MKDVRSPLQYRHTLNDRSKNFATAVCLAILVLSFTSFAQNGPPASLAEVENSQTAITLHDAMPIHLRFAERVCGVVPGFNAVAAKQGASVRLVTTRDLYLKNKVVIAHGALALATVDRVLPGKLRNRHSSRDPVVPGVSLRLESVTSVTGDQIPLRGGRKGPAKAVDLIVLFTKGGAEVRLVPEASGMFGFLWRTESALSYGVPHFVGDKPEDVCIPEGARMLAYADGDVSIGAAQLEQAQAALPVPSADAVLYVFRLKEKKKESGISPPLICNQIKVAALGPQQMAVANLPPGKYSCQIGNQPAVEFTLARGEYFAQLHRSRHEKWALWWLSPEQGEDLSAETELVSYEPDSSAK